MREYLVPRAVRTRFELFPGWGVAELAPLGLGLVVGGVAEFVAGRLGVTLVWRAALGVTPAATDQAD